MSSESFESRFDQGSYPHSPYPSAAGHCLEIHIALTKVIRTAE
jgi:hypothetical protein